MAAIDRLCLIGACTALLGSPLHGQAAPVADTAVQLAIPACAGATIAERALLYSRNDWSSW